MTESPPPSGPSGRFKKFKRDRSWTVSLIGSYIFDWAVLFVAAIAGGVLSIVEPNKRPFSLLDPNISFPHTENETVPVPLLLVIDILIPFILITIVCLVFVPGPTVPKGTPRSLIWKRKLWELHASYLGLALAIVLAWFVTNGMKNMFGRPRPDLISRCDPDLANFSDYVVGGIAREDLPSGVNQVLTIGMLVSSGICRQTDQSKLDDGFRSYPSGHSSSAAAGLVYLSLFFASKFAVTLPFVAASNGAAGDIAHSLSAFPSRTHAGVDGNNGGNGDGDGMTRHNRMLTSVRRQAAAPPVYLLVAVLTPFFTSIFIAGSRWFDFRHHAFDIMFGYLIGLVGAIFAFYYYHLPIRRGAGWAWGPRSHDKAWWSGVGSHSYATDKGQDFAPEGGDEEEALYSSSVAPNAGTNGLASNGNKEGDQQRLRTNGHGNSTGLADGGQYGYDGRYGYSAGAYSTNPGASMRDHEDSRGQGQGQGLSTEAATEPTATQQSMTQKQRASPPPPAAVVAPAGYSHEDSYYGRSSPPNQGSSYDPVYDNRIRD